jgi:hypothetical protein
MDNIILKRPRRNPMQTIKPKLIFMKLSIYVIDTANIAPADKTEHKNAGKTNSTKVHESYRLPKSCQFVLIITP